MPPLRLAFHTLVAIVLVLLGTSAPGRARAWDPDADVLVARLAYTRLTPDTKAKVDALLADGVAVAGTPCAIRSLDDSARMVACVHGRRQADFMRDVLYDPIPICGEVIPAHVCPDNRCASQLLKRFVSILKNPSAPRDARAMALEGAAYLVSELHQPLHAADNNDRSGERVRVTLPGSSDRRLNLYGVWDEDLVADAIGSADTGLPYVQALAQVHGADWAKGSIDDWVLETHQAAVDVVYARLPQPPACGKLPDKPEALGKDYFGVAVPLVQVQLAKAGVRLAALLDSALN